jgi:hypothetical protein
MRLLATNPFKESRTHRTIRDTSVAFGQVIAFSILIFIVKPKLLSVNHPIQGEVYM